MLKDVFLFKGLKLCLPKCSLREKLLVEHPKLGLFGEDKTFRSLQDKYYWPGITKDVGSHVKVPNMSKKGTTNAGFYYPLPNMSLVMHSYGLS